MIPSPLKTAVFCFLLMGPARGADFTVITTSDSGPGSLRQAILDANQNPGADRILFNIAGAGLHKIVIGGPDNSSNLPVLGGELPAITDPVTIDGYSQPGAHPNTRLVGNDAVILVQLAKYTGSGNSGVGLGLDIRGGNSTVRGLSLTGFSDIGGRSATNSGAIKLESSGNTISGNFIGLAPDGTTPGDGAIGVWVTSGGANTIGANTTPGQGSPADRNVIARQNRGILISGGNQAVVGGNYIGTDATGTSSRACVVGIEVSATRSSIEQPFNHLIQENVVAGNDETAIQVKEFAMLIANFIGVQPDGLSPLGNGGYGVFISGQWNQLGVTPYAGTGGNLIAYNGKSGIAVASRPDALHNDFYSNRIFANGGLPIDLGDDGITLNDPLDPDTGPNNLQNTPIFTFAGRPSPGGPVSLRGVLQTNPSPPTGPPRQFNLQFFHYTPFAEFLGSTNVAVDTKGYATFEVTFPFARTPGPNGEFFGVTTLGPDGTSEMSLTNSPVQLANLSTRARVETGDRILIGGFIVRSKVPKRIGLRALGPSVTVPGHLADPRVELYDASNRMIASNDNWRSSQQQEIIDAGLAPQDDAEAALITSLPEGTYTAQVRGVANGVGSGLLEVYDLDAFPQAAGRLVNLSSRGAVGAGDDPLIGGLIIRGANAERFVVRAIGPDLSAAGVPGALQDPVLNLHDSNGAVIGSNDNWRDMQEAELTQSGLAPGDVRDAAILASLPPGAYTAVVRGKNNSTGLALVEFYDLTND
jgi:hypothetical protein